MRGWILLLVVGTATACGDRPGPGTSSDASTVDGGLCSYPPAADTSHGTSDAGTTGCKPQVPMQICGGPRGCRSACTPEQYQLTCAGGDATTAPPVPDASLGCVMIPVPTPSNTTLYCCACA